MDTFSHFAKSVAGEFQRIVEGQVFVADIDGDALWAAYLAAFPEGSNPLFKTRTEHDCSCCRHFVRRAGVVISASKEQTVWDKAAEGRGPYAIVAKALQGLVRGAGIRDLFRVGKNEASFGSQQTVSLDKVTQKTITWNHFYTGEIPRHLRVEAPDTERGEYRTAAQVFERGLVELSPDAIETVLSLINDNAIYRGAEHKKAVTEFQKVQRQYLALTSGHKHFVWVNAGSPGVRFRNSVIGTLVQDLSEGKELEAAVASYEAKVAPENYKRTKSLVTPGMAKKALETIAQLGLEPALQRRLATLADLSVNDVRWVDGAAKPLMKGGIEDLLMKHVAQSKTAPADSENVETVSIDDFLNKVLPESQSMEVFFANRHQDNLMTITAPVHPEPAQLFRWNNDFAWSYRGGAADSFLRKSVQARGGRVDGVLRFSHMWNHERRNASLMDLHVFLPGAKGHEDGCHDNYPRGPRVGWNCRKDAESGGEQDVDYTAPAPEGYVPVENITFPSLSRLKNGDYTFKIHNWNLRQPTFGGFRAEIEFGGQVFQYDHPEPLKQKEWVTLAVATLKNGIFTIQHKHPVGSAVREVWGTKTEQYVKVTTVTLSPNYWGDNAVGNKHVFFVLDGVQSDEPMRGFYNEFLHPRLETHRKVFDLIAEKTKCAITPGHLAGLGFSSTKPDEIRVRVQQGKRRRVYNVYVGV